MKKKQYEKPVMQVFELKQQPQILAGSNRGVDPLSPFAPGGNPLP
jgi:hypothetical protein